MKERFKKLNNELIPLGDGENPPAERLKQPWDIPCDLPPQICIECGRLHGYVITDMEKETHTPLEKCYDCFWREAWNERK